MIFKTAEQLVRDKDGNVTGVESVVRNFKEANKIQAETNAYYDTVGLNAEKEALDQVIDANERLAKGEISAAEASTIRANATAGLSEEVQALGKSEKTTAADCDNYIKQQKAQIAANEKAAASFKGLSASFKAMAFNIGAELAVMFALQAVMWGLNKLNEEFHITAASKVEAMENAVNNYNDALEQSGDNIDTIKGLEEEFTTLARGVNDAGENIGLSADEYERYHEIVAELVAINPELVQNYDDEGNAIRNNLEEVVN